MSRLSTPARLRLAPFRRRDAVDAGLVTPAQLNGPAWQRLYQGVYIEAAAYQPADHRMWCQAALLAAPPGAAIGGLSAACLWGVDLLPPEGPVTVIVPTRCRTRPQDRLTVVRADLAAGQTERFAGVRLTTPARTAFDLGRSADRVEAAVAVDAMAHRRLVTVAEIAAVADSYPGWPGVARLREVLSLAEPGAASPMETRLRLVIVDDGLPRPTAQYEVRAADGTLVGWVDLAYPDLKIALEYEGDHHREQATFRKDIVRFNRLRAAGWTALRFTADDVFKRPQRIVDDVKRVLAEAAARSPAEVSGSGARRDIERDSY